MSETQPVWSIGRSIGALLAGFVFVVILSLGTDLALHAAGIFPPLGQIMSNALFLLATIYRTVYAVVGSYITARLAPNRPMQHALLGGAIGLVLSRGGRGGDVEQGYGAALVSPGSGCHRPALCLVGRQTPAHAVARWPALIKLRSVLFP